MRTAPGLEEQLLEVNREITKESIMRYGELEQQIVAMEELSELVQAISKWMRKKESNIVEEIADVTIMMDNLKVIHGIDDRVIQSVIDDKQQRLKRRMEGRE